MGAPLDYLSQLLVSRVHVTEAGLFECGGGYAMPEHLVAAPKLLLVVSGEIVYRLEGLDYRLPAGAMFFRGAWTRSSWRVPSGGSGSAVGYCEFLVDAQEPGLLEPVLLDSSRYRVELETVERLTAVWGQAGVETELAMEGEAKAMLARFLSCARASKRADEHGTKRSNSDLLVADAVRWLHHNYGKSDVMAKLSHGGLSANHFRARFRRAVGMSPREYVTTLRMRAARYQLQRSAHPIKQIARSVGFRDPLYFSRMYHEFWARWPSDDRVLPPSHRSHRTPASAPPPRT